MKKLLSLLVLSVMVISTYAGPRSVEEMVDAARKVIKHHSSAKSVKGIQPLEVLKKGTMFDVIGYKNGGFAIIASDDKFAPVLGYSDTEFSIDNMPPAMQWWMDMTEQALQTALESRVDVKSGAALRNSNYPDAVPELLTTKWDQSSPYNDKIVSITGKDYPTGCMATAMAQVMKYHAFPVNGQGYKGYAIDGINRNYDFENTTYDYADMLDEYSRNNYTQVQADAVSTLMLHCGVAVDMNYALGGSGSFSSDAAIALNKYFKYSTRHYTRDIYTKAEWMNIIYDELSNGRPVIYGGVTSQNEGHAFVFDGYDADGLVHVNWGWSGSSNGYYEVALLNSAQGSYSYSQNMIVLHDDKEPVLPYVSQWGILPSIKWSTSTGQEFETTGKFEVRVLGTKLMCSCTNLMNCDVNSFSGNLALLAEPTNSTAPIALKTETLKDFNYNDVYPSNANDYNVMVDISNLKDGTYKIYLATKAVTETDWQPVHFNETIKGMYELTIVDGNASVSSVETGINNLEVDNGEVNGKFSNRIYTIDGHYVGTDASKVGKGLYICNGKKFVKE